MVFLVDSRRSLTILFCRGFPGNSSLFKILNFPDWINYFPNPVTIAADFSCIFAAHHSGSFKPDN